MLSGIALTLAVLVIVVLVLGGLGRLWLRGSQAFIAERVQVELEQRLAERQIQHIAYTAMQRMVDEARRGHGL
jgi:hypothetical protein